MAAKYALWLLITHGQPPFPASYWSMMILQPDMSWSQCRESQVSAEKVYANRFLCLPEGFDPNGGAK
jgi:hypothetical protein